MIDCWLAESFWVFEIGGGTVARFILLPRAVFARGSSIIIGRIIGEPAAVAVE